MTSAPVEWLQTVFRHPDFLPVVVPLATLAFFAGWAAALRVYSNAVGTEKSLKERAEKDLKECREQKIELESRPRLTAPWHLSNSELRGRAFELAAEIRALQRLADSANEILAAAAGDESHAAQEATQARYAEMLADVRAQYRRIQPELVAVRDALVSRVSAAVVRARRDGVDQTYLVGFSIMGNFDDISADLEQLARSLAPSAHGAGGGEGR
jgi:ElaB/YqjD/DUF883 family membrane-anchored ribosome-binding protein